MGSKLHSKLSNISNFAKYTKSTKTHQVQSPVVPNREVWQFKSENKVDKARTAPLIEIPTSSGLGVNGVQSLPIFQMLSLATTQSKVNLT